MNKSAVRMMEESKIFCSRIAEGEFSPVIFERYEWIGGDKGIRYGHFSRTVEGKSCIVWKHSSLNRWE